MSEGDPQVKLEDISISETRKRPRNNEVEEPKVKTRKNRKMKRRKFIVKARKTDLKCSCAISCLDRVGQDNIVAICSSYCGLEPLQQNAYLQKQVNVELSRNKNNALTERRKYYVDVGSEQVIVCKQAFESIHGLAIKKVTNAPKALKSKEKYHGKMDEAASQLVTTHIKSFPTMTSFYSRKTIPNVIYLPFDIKSKQQMFELYVEWMKEYHPQEQIVNFILYCKEWKKNFPNLTRKQPKLYPCKKCPSLNQRLHDSKIKDEEKKAVESQMDSHKAEIKVGNRLPVKLVHERPAAMVIGIDIQQTLPTPKVNTGASFYKRRMWTSNFVIHNYGSGTGYIYVWDETQGKRGAVEIISCLDLYIKEYINPMVDELIIFSENRSEQNEHYNLIMYYLHLIHKNHFVEISHIYIQSGHKYSKTDHCFKILEKNIEQEKYIFTLKDYVNVLIQQGLLVKVMEQADFKNWDTLLMYCSESKPSENSFSDYTYFRLSRDYMSGYSYGTSYSQYESCTDKQVDCHRVKMESYNSKLFNLSEIDLQPKYHAPIQLSREKLTDLKQLVYDLVPPNSHVSYWNAILLPKPDPDSISEHDSEPVWDEDMCDYD